MPHARARRLPHIVRTHCRPVVPKALDELGQDRSPHLNRQTRLVEQPILSDALLEQAWQMTAVDLHQADVPGAITVGMIHRLGAVTRLYDGDRLQQLRLDIVVTITVLR